MNALVGQQHNPQNLQHDVLGAGPADTELSPIADTLPSSSPPPTTETDDENPTVAPSSTISPETPLDSAVAHDDKDPPTVHTSELVRTDAEDMLLDSSDTDTPSDPAGGQVEDGQDWMPDGQEQEMKRVKACTSRNLTFVIAHLAQVYELVGQRWVDQGTAFCFGQFQEDSEHAHLIARSERNYSDIILSTPIRSTDVYQRQQGTLSPTFAFVVFSLSPETLIVWTEPNGADYALSFQDPEGCLEVWNFILDVQNHINVSDEHALISSSPIVGPEPSVTISRNGQLPAPQLGIIADIERAIKGFSKAPQVKDRLCEYIMRAVSLESRCSQKMLRRARNISKH